ncbi:MAG: Sir2 family NAD-dependent protein deacetylase [Deltaproteobacteria bacterium]|nr:MAG: Sir2 family NAD-dependent protein deacetylase [Deltaproteobacteria bacterium]
MKESIELISRKIRAGGKNVVFTGAGISTESGIPDFRSQGGIWEKFRPVYFDEFMSSRKAREEYWRRWVVLYKDLMRAKPNPAHQALVKLHEWGLLKSVITQNVDGLHQASGLPDEMIIELHGNTRRIRCMGCHQLTPIEEVRQRLNQGEAAPECSCGGYLKPDTISFGQAMPMVEVEKATALSKDCNFFLVVGSTLIVQPAAQMPYYAKKNGAFLGIINLSETPCDSISDVLIQGKAGEVLPKIIRELA